MLEEFKEIISQYVDVDESKITEDARFMEDLGFNSYDFMSLVGEVEERYDVEVEEREVYLSELKDMAEAGLCGTAAVISPVGKIVDHGEEICLPSGMEAMGPVIQKLYDTLTGIQMGRIEAPEGWVRVIVDNK